MPVANEISSIRGAGRGKVAMAMQPIRFDDGDAYERLMGIWSGIVGLAFLDWLSPAPGQRWADIGCGNGAFTELDPAQDARRPR